MRIPAQACCIGQPPMEAGFAQFIDKPLLYGLIAFYAIGAVYVLAIQAARIF